MRAANLAIPFASDPILREMDWLLDDPELFQWCADDVRRHYAPSDTGRPSVVLEVVYRLTVLRRQWSLRRAQQEVDDSPCYRDWVRAYDQAVPHYSTLNELERPIRPDMLRRMNERLLVLAQAHELTRGYCLRVDSTVSESHIAYSTDNGHPPDEQLLAASLADHRKVFGHAPRVLAADRGFFSPANEHLAQRQGIQQIAMPQKGYKTAARQAHEKQPWFKHGQRFRNGIEGRLRVVRRTVQLKRCPYRGLDSFERWTGWGVFVANLVSMARLIHQRSTRRRRRRP